MEDRNWRKWAKHNATNILRVAIILLFLGLAIWAIVLNHFGRVITNSEPWLLLTDALIDVAPELAGIVIGVVTIDYLNERRQREQLKAQLIRQMGMNIRDVAVLAVRELEHHGWLRDGSLCNAYFEGADLSGARLWGANLIGAYLVTANLSEAGIGGANLSKARLHGANLSGTLLINVDLSECDLSIADLTGTILDETNLAGASLTGANMEGASDWTIEQLEQAKTLEAAIMPDGVQLRIKGHPFLGDIEGATFQEWKAQYLAKHGGTFTDIRNPVLYRAEPKHIKPQYIAKQQAERAEDNPDGEPDDVADGLAESDSPELL